jgi:topoisomerase-4 subunit A
MIVMEKWVPKKPISAIYFDGEKERFFAKRFLIENENKEECFITSHDKSNLEIVSTDWIPIAEIEFAKERGIDRKDNLLINLEEFISVKGINALGNQLTKDKVNQINLLEPLPYESPQEVHAEDIEVVGEENVSLDSDENLDTEKGNQTESNSKGDKEEDDDELDEKGQIKLF